MNVEIGTETAQFLFLGIHTVNGIFVAVLPFSASRRGDPFALLSCYHTYVKFLKTFFPAFPGVRPPHCPTDRQRTEASTAAFSRPWTGWAASSTAWPQPSASRRSRRRGWKRGSGLPIPSLRPGCPRKRSDCEYLFVFFVAY
jgi:hypothetical protein